MKSKFKLPEAIFDVTQSFPNKTTQILPESQHSTDDARKPVRFSLTDINTLVKDELNSENVIEIAKWTALVTIITVTFSTIY